MKNPPILDALTDALKRLPGVGPKSAQRFAYHLLQHDRDGASMLGRTLTEALGRILYTDYVYLFQAAGLILLVAMIGAIVLTHRERGGTRAQNISRQVARRPQDATRNVKPAVGQGVEL